MRSDFAASKVDALLVSSPANVRYLSGYCGSNGLVLLTGRDTYLFTDPRYASACADLPVTLQVVRKPLIVAAAEMVKRKRIKRVGYEPIWINVSDFSRLKEGLKASLVPVSGLVEQHRAIKSPSEIEKIRKSVAVNSEAYSRTLKRIKVGVRELDIAAELDYHMRKLGAEKSAFDTIVASGPRTAFPHAHPTLARVASNELLLIDMGATLDGYASDMTRVSFLGTPSRKVKAMYRAVLEAQLAGVDAVRPGVTAGHVDSAARNILKKYKLEEAFVHSTGHGLGLEIHEGPRIAGQDKSPLRPGMVITIEPGAYVEGFGGIRIEDTVLVTSTGREVLTPTSKEFITF